MRSKLSTFFFSFLVAATLGLVTGPASAYWYSHDGHRYYSKGYKCKWVGGYWRHGYWHRGHKVCWRKHWRRW